MCTTGHINDERLKYMFLEAIRLRFGSPADDTVNHAVLDALDTSDLEVEAAGLIAQIDQVAKKLESLILDPPICLMSGGSFGFERGRDEWAGGSVPASHRSLPHFACQGLLHDSGLGPLSKGGLIRPALSGVAPTLIARAVRTPSPTARFSADAGTASWPGERSGPGCR